MIWLSLKSQIFLYIFICKIIWNCKCEIITFQITLNLTFISKLGDCLEDVGYVGLTLANIVIILLLYVDDIVLMVNSLYGLGKQLIILKELFSSMDMTMTTNKTKVMIIISKRITYDTFVYDNNSLEKVSSYKYLELISITSSIGTIALKKW